MYLLVIVLMSIELLEEVIRILEKENIYVMSIVDGVTGENGNSVYHDIVDVPIIGGMVSILKGHRAYNKTILEICYEKDVLKKVVERIKNVFKSEDSKNCMISALPLIDLNAMEKSGDSNEEIKI
ncbi:MAG: hypothetical protein PWP21_326 [Thermosediminibacterales bacterium]|nr:hypothetical protein [Thermosediminibacterales bacterium]